jgi:hypothetical protein
MRGIGGEMRERGGEGRARKKFERKKGETDMMRESSSYHPLPPPLSLSLSIPLSFPLLPSPTLSYLSLIHLGSARRNTRRTIHVRAYAW